jgi:hypothetical protein
LFAHESGKNRFNDALTQLIADKDMWKLHDALIFLMEKGQLEQANEPLQIESTRERLGNLVAFRIGRSPKRFWCWVGALRSCGALGFKRFPDGGRCLRGIELAQKIKKHQFNLGCYWSCSSSRTACSVEIAASMSASVSSGLRWRIAPCHDSSVPVSGLREISIRLLPSLNW